MSAVIDLTRHAEEEARLEKVYRRQKQLIKSAGITIPPEQELFLEGAPLEAKVAFYSWVIHEAIS